MLQILREKSKIILWVVAIAFIGFMVGVWGMDLRSGEMNRSAATIGEVNGTQISVKAYRDEINTLVQNYRSQNADADPPEDLRRQFNEQAWQNLVQRVVVQDEVERRGLAATDREIVNFIRMNPLPVFVQNPSLQTNGQFDITKYHQLLNDPRYDWSTLEAYARSLLPVEKLRQEVSATVRVSDDEIREQFLADQEQVKVTYLAVSPYDFRDTTATATDEEVAAYYRDNPDEFKMPEQAVLKYVLFDKGPSEADEEEVRTRAAEIVAEARGGADFAELAKIYSEDEQSATQGGDLGFFGRGMMVPEFEEAAFALTPGEISEPVQSKLGFHVIELQEKRGDGENEPLELHARHILLKIYPGSETVDRAYEMANEFSQTARKQGFDKAAEAAGLTATTTTPFTKGEFVPGIGRFARAARFAFDNKAGATSAVFEGPQGLYVFNVESRAKEGVPPLDGIRDNVANRVLLKRQREAARARAEQIVAALRSGKSLEEAGGDFGLPPRQTPFFTRISTVGGIGKGSAFTYAAFMLEPGQTSGAIQTNSGFYVLRVDDKKEADETQFEARKKQIRQLLHQAKLDMQFSEFVQNLLAQSDIEDRRGLQIQG